MTDQLEVLNDEAMQSLREKERQVRERVAREKGSTPTSKSEVVAIGEITTAGDGRPCARCKEQPARQLGRAYLLCPECVDALGQAEKAQKAEEESFRRRRDLRANLEAIGVNVRKYFDQQPATFENFDQKPDHKAFDAAFAFVDRFRSGERGSLYLYGERPDEELACGNGKTMLAVAILRELALDPSIETKDMRFVFVPELLLDIQDTFDNPERRTLGIVRRYAQPELLVWDDLGAEKLSDFAIRTIYTILYKREGRSNVFTSNLSLDDIEQRDPSTARITSRIAGDARIAHLFGPDRRSIRRTA